jgi:hypothetical protein
MLSVIGTPAAVDERARYRGLFCEALGHIGSSQADGACDEFLWRLPDEPVANAPTHPLQSSDHRVQVLIVGGAFGDCFPPASTPFAESVKRLREEGFSIDYISVSGRSSAKLNSEVIAARIAGIPSEHGRPLILIGYSKGTVDILESLIGYPEAAGKVSAVVSIAGAVNGSPLSGRYARLYHAVFSKLALGSCPAGDGGVLNSLERSRRLTWLADHPLPTHIKYYSMAAFTTAPRLARALGYMQRQLSKIDPRNDGQLLAEDEVIPGSALLGYANADHWAVALRIEDKFPFLAHRAESHPFPQHALLDSILLLVEEDLGVSGAAAHSPQERSKPTD